MASVKCCNSNCAKVITFDPSKLPANRILICTFCKTPNRININRPIASNKSSDTPPHTSPPDQTVLISAEKKVEHFDQERAGWLVSDEAAPKVFQLKEEKNTLGRGQFMAIGIEDGAISKIHFSIDAKNVNGAIRCCLQDESSTNGTFLNGRKLTSFDKFYLVDNDTIHAGGTDFIFVSIATATSEEHAIKFVSCS